MALRKICAVKSGLFNMLVRNFSASSQLHDVGSQMHEKVAATQGVNDLKVSDWERAIEEAVKCVGYQTPYLTLRYLTNDEDVKWMDHMKKLEGTNHPMNETAK